MKKNVKFIYLILILIMVTACTKDSAETFTPLKAENVIQVEADLLAIVNEHRATLALNKLDFSSVAYQYANEHNDYMIAKGNLSHDNFSKRATSISSLENAEYVAENIAKDYNDASQAFRFWIKSKDHKSTIEGKFTHTGISVMKNAAGKYYFTQIFYR